MINLKWQYFFFREVTFDACDSDIESMNHKLFFGYTDKKLTEWKKDLVDFFEQIYGTSETSHPIENALIVLDGPRIEFLKDIEGWHNNKKENINCSVFNGILFEIKEKDSTLMIAPIIIIKEDSHTTLAKIIQELEFSKEIKE